MGKHTPLHGKTWHPTQSFQDVSPYKYTFADRIDEDVFTFRNGIEPNGKGRGSRTGSIVEMLGSVGKAKRFDYMKKQCQMADRRKFSVPVAQSQAVAYKNGGAEIDWEAVGRGFKLAQEKAHDEGKFEHAITNPNNLYDRQKLLPNMALYTPQDDWVGEWISPSFSVRQTEGRYLEWTPATSHRLYDARIGTGEEPKEIETSATQHTYTLYEYALANRVFKRDLQNSDPPARYLETSTWALRNAMMLAREARVLNVALSALVPGVAAAAGAWNVAAGTPITDVINRIAAIYTATQAKPTDIVIPFHRAITLVNTTEWIARFGGFDLGYSGPLFKVATGFENLGLRVHFSGVCALTTDQGTASDPNLFANIIGNTALVYVRQDAPTLQTRCFMFSPYTVKDEFISGEWGLEKKTRSIYMQQYEETQELLIDANCGSRITGI